MIYAPIATLCFVYATSGTVSTTPSTEAGQTTAAPAVLIHPGEEPDEELLLPDVPAPAAQAQSVLDLQTASFAQTQQVKSGDKSHTVTLTHLNPRANMWFLLSSEKHPDQTFHLENSDVGQTVGFDPDRPGHLRLRRGAQNTSCDFFKEDNLERIEKERDDNRSYSAVCDGALYVRNPLEGRQTAKEFVAEFLRDNIWGGEEITTLVKETIYKDKFVLTSQAGKDGATVATNARGPQAARLKTGEEKTTLEPKELGIVLEKNPTSLSAGQWYNAVADEGLYVSLYRPDLVPEDLLSTYTKQVDKLDSTESEALVISVAMDMSRYEIGFAIGTDHPRVGWSDRVPEELVDKSLAGPDGFDDKAPLVGTGKLPPHLRSSVVATFAGGFKRSHGAFKWGTLSKINHSSHYGWMEQGVLISRLHPGLATVAIELDGKIHVKTWTDRDQADLFPKLRHARQNGVPIIDGVDDETGVPIPGTLVGKWGAGNWSGSIDSKQRTLRAAMCHQKTERGEFLIYSYFSGATPSAMARVFQAYGCRYAIHLDMNALEHTYFAAYFQQGKEFRIEHLNTGMSVLDSKHKGEALPRFVGQADNRDFFYLIRKELSH